MSDGSNPWVTAAADAQRQMLEMIERGQNAILDAVKQWQGSGDWRAPDQPNPLANPLANPLVSGLPTPEEVIQGQFEFAERVLSAQRRFAEQLLAAVRPSGNS